MTGCTVRRYEQLETFPETIEQELRPAVCERRQTDRQTDRRKENYSIDDAWYAGWNNMMETKKIMAHIGIYVAEWTNNLSNMEILWKGRKAA